MRVKTQDALLRAWFREQAQLGAPSERPMLARYLQQLKREVRRRKVALPPPPREIRYPEDAVTVLQQRQAQDRKDALKMRYLQRKALKIQKAQQEAVNQIQIANANAYVPPIDVLLTMGK